MSGNYNQALTQWEGEPEFVLSTISAGFCYETDSVSLVHQRVALPEDEHSKQTFAVEH